MPFTVGYTPWNKGLDWKPRSAFKKGQSPWNKGKSGLYKHSEESKEKIGLAVTDEKHPSWKGNNVGYRGLHTWIQRKLGIPDVCENCGANGLSGHKIHWANRSGSYNRIKSDWLRLCTFCHKAYDKGREDNK